MSEIFPEPNSDDITEFEPLVQNIELSDTAVAVKEFDETRREMFDKIKQLVARPTDRSVSTILDTGGAVIKKFMTCVDTIVQAEDYTHEMKVNAVTQLMLDEDKERLELFSKLLEDNESYTSSPYKRETVMEIVSSAFRETDSKDVLITFLGEQMGNGMGLDLERLVDHLPDMDDEYEDEESQLTQKQILLRKIGHEALDVVKLGLGVAGGMLIARAFSKRK